MYQINAFFFHCVHLIFHLKQQQQKKEKKRYSSKIAFLSWLWDLKNILHSLLALTMSTFVYLTSSRKRRKMQGHLLY